MAQTQTQTQTPTAVTFTARLFSFKLFGFQVHVDASWLILAFLITWTLAEGLFPSENWYPGFETVTYWIMGAASAVGLFVSIVLHECGHAVVARKYGIPIRGITLFIFGGVAQMDREPDRARDEFYMAIAGPIVSIALAAVFYAPGYWLETTPTTAVLSYLGLINAVLAGFNLIPAFPLDGGRVLRAALWGWKHNLTWATRITSEMGSGFGLALIFLGILSLFGNPIGGVWWILIGFFIRGASKMSFQNVLVKNALSGELVSRFMKTHVVTVPRSLSVYELVEDYIYKYHHKLYPVMDNGRLEGCVLTQTVKNVNREAWPNVTVGDIMEQPGPDNSIKPDADAMDALNAMQRSGKSRLMVVDHGELAGVITLKDLMEYLRIRLEFEQS